MYSIGFGPLLVSFWCPFGHLRDNPAATPCLSRVCTVATVGVRQRWDVYRCQRRWGTTATRIGLDADGEGVFPRRFPDVFRTICVDNTATD